MKIFIAVIIWFSVGFALLLHGIEKRKILSILAGSVLIVGSVGSALKWIITVAK